MRRKDVGITLALPRVDLHSVDENGLPWAVLDAAPDTSRTVHGAHIIVGSGKVRAVVILVDVVERIVGVRPRRAAFSALQHLLAASRVVKAI